MKRDGIRLRPTGLWVVFGPVLGCMWLAAVNYSNNLVYAVLYLIASLSFISIFHTWRNLSQLTVEHMRIHPAFAGEDVEGEVYLSNPGGYPVYGLVFARVSELWRQPVQLPLRGRSSVRVAPDDSCVAGIAVMAQRSPSSRFPRIARLLGMSQPETLNIPVQGHRRGLYRFETLQVKSAYPFGLFWASFNVTVGVEYYVYPKPRGTEDWPELRPGGESGSPFSTKPGDDFAGVRAYVPGESLRHVDWKAYARGRPLSVKQFTGGEGQELWLDAAMMSSLPLEERLSQLALWILNAEKAEIPYALRLGRAMLPLGLGPTQCRRALETLAVAGVGPQEPMS